MSTASDAFREAVYEVTAMIPEGSVATYAQVATYVVSPRYARGVGAALKHLPPGRHAEVPWHRVINASGRISAKGETFRPVRQERLLRREGVAFDRSGRVNLMLFQWSGPGPDWVPPLRP